MVNVLGVDANNNIILGAGAPTPSLVSHDTAALAVSSPSPATLNQFTITPPQSPPNQPGSTVHLTAKVTPGSGSAATAVTSSAISMTFNQDICGYITKYSAGISEGVNWITAGPDSSLWFSESDRIGKITTTAVVTEYKTCSIHVPPTIE